MFYVYRILDKNKKVLYVNSTTDIGIIVFHLERKGYLSESQYREMDKIEFLECLSLDDMYDLEEYLINLWKPPYNTPTEKSSIYVDLDKLIWQDFSNKEKKRIIHYFRKSE